MLINAALALVALGCGGTTPKPASVTTVHSARCGLPRVAKQARTANAPPLLSLQVHGIGCGQARGIIASWNRSCSPNGKACHVRGFACVVPLAGPATGLKCSKRQELVLAKLAPF